MRYAWCCVQLMEAGAAGLSGGSAAKPAVLECRNAFDAVTLHVRSSEVVNVVASSLKDDRVKSLTAKASSTTS